MDSQMSGVYDDGPLGASNNEHQHGTINKLINADRKYTG